MIQSSNSDAQSVIVVGGGQAGYQVAVSLREKGFGRKIRIISEEPYLPYQRPPLSKRPLLDSSARDLP